MWVACTATVITVFLASIYAFALTNVNMKGKGFFKVVAFLPILAPSLLPSLALVYLFGKQGVFKPLLGDIQIYGPIGIFNQLLFLAISSNFNVNDGVFSKCRSAFN